MTVYGHEHHVCATADVARRFDAGSARHLHVEEAHVGAVLVEQLNHLAAVARLRDDLERRTYIREKTRERAAQRTSTRSYDGVATPGKPGHRPRGLSRPHRYS